MFRLLVSGFILGLSISAPVGPIGVLTIRRTLAFGRTHGFVSGLGAATADATYGLIAAFGLTLLSDILIAQQSLFGLLGGTFLIYLGITTFRSRPATTAAQTRLAGETLRGGYLSTLFLTLTNPITILLFPALFAGAGISAADNTGALLMVVGVFSGSALWWFTLSGGVSLLRSRFDARVMLWVNRLSGVVITAFGVGALVRAF